jgi:hypothetical protein
MYGTMWALNMRFDTRFFTIASCMLGNLEITVIDFGVGIRDFVHYLTAEKRITVSLFNNLFTMKAFDFIGISFT